MRKSLRPLLSVDTDRIFVVERDEVVRSALQFILDDHSETHGFTGLDQAFAKAAEFDAGYRPARDRPGAGQWRTAVAEIAARLPGTKILIVANSANDPLALLSLKWGAHDVLGKPITFDSVRSKVDAMLGRHSVSPSCLGCCRYQPRGDG